MQAIGIRKTAGGFLLTKPNLEKSAVCVVEEILLDKLLDDEFADEQQEILEQLYKDSRSKQTWWSNFWSVFKTENAFWHIQGIISTAMLAVSLYFLIASLAGVEPIATNVPSLALEALIAIGIVVSTYSLWALFSRRRPRKRFAALALFMVYVFQLIYLNLVGDGTALINITFLSLSGVAIALFSEWSRPSR